MFINCCNIFCASEAVRRLHADATNEELHKRISSWLVGSRDRGGERAEARCLPLSESEIVT